MPNKEKELKIDNVSTDEVLSFIKSLCGKNDDGGPKVMIQFSMNKFEDEDTVTSVHEYTSTPDEISFSTRGNFVELVMKYDSYLSNDLKESNEALNTFGDYINDLNETDDNAPAFLSVMIMPYNKDDDFYIQLLNPVLWAAQSLFDKKPDATLHILFNIENFEIGALSDIIDLKELQAQAEREAAEYESMLHDETKEDKDDTFLKDMYDEEQRKLLENEEEVNEKKNRKYVE